jgi:hypothetical protein
MSMSVGERDKKMSDVATKAATAFCRKCEGINDQEIERAPEAYLGFTVPYLTVRALHRQEEALNSLKADSKWIKYFAILTGILTAALVALTIVLAFYAWRLDTVTHSLQPNASPSPTPPTATTTP